MKTTIYMILTSIFAGLLLSACEDKDYLLGKPEYDHHHYIAFIPYNNTQVSVNRSQTALLKFPVQFQSSLSRSYDAVAQYKIVSPATNAAVLGVDYDIVDRNGAVIQAVEGKYSITFQKAERRKDTIYVKLLNNTSPGIRTTEIQLMENVTSEYRVDTLSTAFRRPIRIQ